MNVRLVVPSVIGSVMGCLILIWIGQAGSAELRSAQGTLSVSATGTSLVRPDKALTRFAVETTGESLHLVQEANARRMQRVIARLHELGILEERIQTSRFQLVSQYPRRRQPAYGGQDAVPKIIGYMMKHTLTVEVRDLVRVGQIVDEFLDAGANRFDAITWGLQDEHPVRLRALTLAARKAQWKADALARALGLSFLRVLHVTETQARPIRQSYQLASAMSERALEEAVPVAPGELSVQSTVTLTYEVERK